MRARVCVVGVPIVYVWRSEFLFSFHCGFQELNSGHKICTASAFAWWTILPAHILPLDGESPTPRESRDIFSLGFLFSLIPNFVYADVLSPGRFIRYFCSLCTRWFPWTGLGEKVPSPKKNLQKCISPCVEQSLQGSEKLPLLINQPYESWAPVWVIIQVGSLEPV